MLVEIEIDTGNHPPIASKPYTLPLKTLRLGTERNRNFGTGRNNREKHLTMGITRSNSPKEKRTRQTSQKENVHRLPNKLQPEVAKADFGKGCISLITLPKLDELFAKLKGYKVFSSLDLRSGYYHIGLKDSAKPKSAFVLSSLGKYQFNRVPFGLAQAPAYFPETDQRRTERMQLCNGLLR